MKKKSLFRGLAIVLLVGFMFSGCAQKTQIRAIKSANVTDKSIKNIGVTPFKNDDIAQASQIDSAISNIKIKGKKYFHLVDRENINQVLAEKKFNDSGLVDLIKENSSDGLSQIETLVTGTVNVSDMSTTKFKEERIDYSTCVQSYTQKGKTYCSKYRKYYVDCQANRYNVKTKVKLIKISDASTTFANTYEASTKFKHCTDDSVVLPSKKEVNSKLANIIAYKLIKDIAPSYVYFTVVLLDDVDVDMNKKQEKLFQNALEMIKHQRVEKANEMLTKLNKQLNLSSYVVLYDLAVTEESLGNVDNAYKLLKKAEDLALETDGVIEEIAIAVKRVKKNIGEKNKVTKLLKI